MAESVLHRVGTHPAQPADDVVFVHGLGGSHPGTWSNPRGQCWPEWLAADNPEWRVWSLTYDAEPRGWLGNPLPLYDRATEVIPLLRQNGIGNRPLALIGHSLGGLLIKQLLMSAHTLGDADWQRLSARCHGVVFVATPSTGADMATYLRNLGELASVAMHELASNAAQLRQLATWYRGNVVPGRTDTLAFWEREKTRRLAVSVQVVDATSADPGISGAVAIGVEADHLTICKPAVRESLAAEVERQLKLWLARDEDGFGSVAVRPFTVPSSVSDFTGREAEIAELEKALTSNGRAAICAVSGMGGIGKSQLAFEVARRMAGRFPDGQVYLDMRGTAAAPLSPEAALAELISAVHPAAKPPDDLADLKALYRQSWRERRALLLLDNARDEAQVRDLSPTAPVAMLVTSRRQIVLEGGRMLPLGVLPEPEAVGLLHEVLGTVWAITEEEAKALAEECGCLPLALRAAASFLLRRMAWTVAEYLAELRGRGIEALDTVGTVLGLSLDRLAEEDAELARRFTLLGAFPAGFDAAAAAAVWQAEPRAARDALDLLAEWSLVQVEAAGRYRLHDLVRNLAVERAQLAALDNARMRHAGHYRDLLAQARGLCLSGGAGLLQGLALFDAERINIEAGQRWAAGRAGSRDDAAALVSSYSDAEANVLDLRLTPRQQIEWLNAALAACRRLGDRRGEGSTLGNLGIAWKNLGEPRKAIGFFEQVLSIAGELGSRRGEAQTLGNLGNAWAELGELKLAIDYHEQRLAAAREFGDRRSEGQALGNLGSVWTELGEPKKAIDFQEQRLAITREIGDRRGEGQALGNLGIAWEALGEPKKALDLQNQRLAITREIGDRRGEGITLANSASTYEKIGEHGKAITTARTALTIFRTIESPHAATVEAWLRERGIEP